MTGSPLTVVSALLLASTALADLAATMGPEAEDQTRPQETYLRDDLDKYQELRETNKLLHEPDYLERLLTEALDKRASMRGFQGMRGKKNEYELAPEPAPYYDYYDKRAPMGFQGMRGKKSDFDDELDKRAPMGFQGMRGKKSFEQLLDDLSKRAKTGFHGMRGKKAQEMENQPEQQEDFGGYKKRGPMGFQGMRGRKSYLEQLDDLEKRALLGFHGMRGKKDLMYEREEPLVSFDSYMEKRPMMGFHGMRGKRSVDYFAAAGSRYEKRAPYRFYGTRGKKNPRWELRGKFVGVRGKKWTAPPGLRLSSIYDELARDDSARY